jgi:hypothetical protein
MENIRYEMTKDNIIIHSAECPINLFQHIIPYRDHNICDMTKIYHNNKEYILYGALPPEFAAATGISLDDHLFYINGK